jgi:hypothetical protein
VLYLNLSRCFLNSSFFLPLLFIIIVFLVLVYDIFPIGIFKSYFNFKKKKKMKKVTAQQCCVQRSAATSNLFCFVLNGDFRLQKTQFYYVLFTVLDLNSFADIVGIVLFQCYCTLRLIRTVRWY